jgi:dTMP kinase
LKKNDRPNSPGYLITFEGTDGCGKTTQVEMLVEYLVSFNMRHAVFREPGGTMVGEQIRQILEDSNIYDMCAGTEAALFAAARSQLVHQEVKTALRLGLVVLLDRYIDSSLAYQGYARGLGFGRVLELNRLAIDDVWPDLTFLIDMDPEVAMNRLSSIADRIEKLGIEFQHKVRDGYIKVAEMYPDRIRVLDGTRTPQEIFKDIKMLVDALIVDD